MIQKGKVGLCWIVLGFCRQVQITTVFFPLLELNPLLWLSMKAKCIYKLIKRIRFIKFLKANNKTAHTEQKLWHFCYVSFSKFMHAMQCALDLLVALEFYSLISSWYILPCSNNSFIIIIIIIIIIIVIIIIIIVIIIIIMTVVIYTLAGVFLLWAGRLCAQ